MANRWAAFNFPYDLFAWCATFTAPTSYLPCGPRRLPQRHKIAPPIIQFALAVFYAEVGDSLGQQKKLCSCIFQCQSGTWRCLKQTFSPQIWDHLNLCDTLSASNPKRSEGRLDRRYRILSACLLYRSPPFHFSNELNTVSERTKKHVCRT